MLKKFTRTLEILFGRFSWDSPAWVRHLKQSIYQAPRAFFIFLSVFIFSLAALLYFYHSLPQPEQVIAKISVPNISRIEDNVLTPDVLTFDFGIMANNELQPRSVAPIHLIGKDIVKGIKTSPNMSGTWKWDTDSRLIFTPAADWPAGETYTIKFDPDFFSQRTNMASLKESFTTRPFKIDVSKMEFYQDPVNPGLRQIVATLAFTFPVDTNSLQENINLAWQALKNNTDNTRFNYTLTYDEHKRKAYLKSDIIPLPDMPRYMELTLNKGIKPQTGPSETTKKISELVLVPDAASYFKINHAATSIVRNPQDRPEQILTIETTLGVKQEALDKGLHVYLLPQDYPATRFSSVKTHYAWSGPGEVTQEILALAVPLKLQSIPAGRDYATLHSYKYNTNTPAYIYVTIDKGVQGFGNFVLAKPFAAVLTVPAYPQEISFLHKGALLALGTEEKLSVLVRGLGAVKFNFARILPQDISHLITQTSGDFSNPYFTNVNFTQDNISDISSNILTFDASNPGREQYTALDLGQYFKTNPNPAGNRLGLFLLQATGWDKEKNEAINVQANRLVLITDLGLIVKDNANGTHDVFVQSITTGLPVNQASVSVLGKNGLSILTRSTDAEGHVIFPSLKDFVNEKEPSVYLVTHNNDVSFIPYNRYDRQLNYSRFDIGGVTQNLDNPSALTAYIFTERGIYRPGDIIHAGMIVKQPYLLPQPAGLPLEVTVVDPRGTTIKDVKTTLNEEGFFTFDFQTQETSPTGQYQIYLYIVKDHHASNLIGSTTVNIAEFLPDRLRITARLLPEQKGWVSPAELTAKIKLWNLYGAPAANHKIAGKLLLTPQPVRFKAYPDYIFIDPLLNPKNPPKVFTDTLTDTKTNEQGEAEFDLKLDKFEKTAYQLTLFAEGFEADGGRSVTTQVKTLVSPLAYFVGYKPDGELTYIRQGYTRQVNFIAINSQLTQQNLDGLTLQIFSQKPVSTLVKKEDGTYQYQSIMQTTQISSMDFTISQQSTRYTLSTQDIGDFLVIVADKNGNELSRFKYSVVGSSQQSLPKNAELNVKLNKEIFVPGEEIEMQITAPYAGAGLMTLERDKVYAAHWFKTNTTSSLQKIHIPADFQGNGYVNIAMVRDLNSPEIFMSPLSFNVQPFSVSHENHVAHIDLSVPDLSRPGDMLTMNYKTDKPCKIILFAVDEGILQVTKYQTPDPLAFFFAKHALEVNTSQIVDQILPKFIAERELSSAGGDGSNEALLKNLNPFKRKTETPVVYWSGILDADTTLRQVTYRIPEYFNGSLRIMAVAVAKDTAGFAARSSQVKGHFVIYPNVPVFAAPDDEFDVNASIANNVQGSGEKAKVKVTLSSSNALTILNGSTQEMMVPQGQERSIHFKVRVLPILGSASLTFTAAIGDKTSQLSSTLSVRPAVPYMTSLESGFTRDAEKSLVLSRILYPEFRKVEAAASYSPLILLTGIQNYLNDYPYGCIEQLVSKAFPWLAIIHQDGFTHDTQSLQDKIQETIQLLIQRQMSNGGFNYWPEIGTTQSNDFASVYAVHFLTEAKSQGFSVPNEVFSASMGFLQDIANQYTNSLEQARIQAYAIYVLTRNELITTNYLTHLQLALDQHPEYHWHNDILSAYIASAYQLLKNTNDAEKIIAAYKPGSPVAAANDFYNNNTANAQYLYLVAKHFPQRLAALDNVLMSLITALNNESITTLLSGYTSLALSAYPAPALLNTSPLITETMTNNKKFERGQMEGIFKKIQVDMTAVKVNFINTAKSKLFYQLTQAGFDQQLPGKTENHGIEVYREFRDANDKVVHSVNLGDDLTVHIVARAVDNQYHSNVALVDLLPGGFDVVRESVQASNMDYVDAREDRVIFFGTLNPASYEIIYKIKAVNKGTYTIPPLFAQAMYNPKVKSINVSKEKMEVK